MSDAGRPAREREGHEPPRLRSQAYGESVEPSRESAILVVVGWIGRLIIGLFGLSFAALFGWGAYSIMTGPKRGLSETVFLWVVAEVLSSAAIFMALAGTLTLAGGGEWLQRQAVKAGRWVILVWGASAILGFLALIALAFLKP